MIYFKYMKLHLSFFPQKIVQQYNLQDLVSTDGYVFMEIGKEIKGLKQARRPSSDHLTKNLDRNGYAPVKHTPFL